MIKTLVAKATTVRALRDSAPRTVVSRLPADVAADDDVASEDGTRAHRLVDRMRDHSASHRELHRARVDDADHVAGSGGLEDAEEGPVAAVLGVELDDLLRLSDVEATRRKTINDKE